MKRNLSLSVLLGLLVLCSPVVLPMMAPDSLPSLSSEALAASSAVNTPAAGIPGGRTYKQRFFTSGTWIARSETVYLTGCGAGGGGAGGHTADPGGGGGGGSSGMCIVRMPVYLTVGDVLTITIGTAGVGGAAGAVGGTTNLDTTIAGLPIGTYTIIGGRRPTNYIAATILAPQPGTVTNGGAGGALSFHGAGGVTGTGAGANCGAVNPLIAAGGDYLTGRTGAAGGGPSNAGGVCFSTSGYAADVSYLAPAASGTKGGGGTGGYSAFGVAGLGGSGAVGGNCVAGYGAGGGGGAATFAGGNGCPGFLALEWEE